MTTNTELTSTEQAIIKAIDEGFTTTRGIVGTARLDKYVVADGLARLTNAGVLKWDKRNRHHGDFVIVEEARCLK